MSRPKNFGRKYITQKSLNQLFQVSSKMKPLCLAFVVSLWAIVQLTEAYPKGAPDSTCIGLVPSPRKHKATPSDKKSPYTLGIHVDKDRLEMTVS